jgi:hypothetical protein
VHPGGADRLPRSECWCCGARPLRGLLRLWTGGSNVMKGLQGTHGNSQEDQNGERVTSRKRQGGMTSCGKGRRPPGKSGRRNIERHAPTLITENENSLSTRSCQERRCQQCDICAAGIGAIYTSTISGEYPGKGQP